MAEAGLRIRVDDELRHDFIATCKMRDTTAAQELRAFMRSYVGQHGQEMMQRNLFDVVSERPGKRSGERE
jgi:hypothetical protein